MTKTTIVAEPGQPTIHITRVFDGPRHLVWKAMTTPELVKRWWGPRGSEMVSCAMDVRVGGKYRFVLRYRGQEDGFSGEYRELVPNEKVVQTFVFDPYPDAPAVETMTLTDHGVGQTLMTVVMVQVSVEARDGMVAAGMEVGMGETHARLDELLGTL
jgi:uncharacterized protein YndB with AHSA1/START domain